MGRFRAVSVELFIASGLFLAAVPASAADNLLGTIHRVETAPPLAQTGVRSDSLLRLGSRTISSWDVKKQAQLLSLWNRGDPSAVRVDQVSLDHLIVHELLVEELFGIDPGSEVDPDVEKRMQEWQASLSPALAKWAATLEKEMYIYVRTKVHFERYLLNRFGQDSLSALLADYQLRDQVIDKLRGRLLSNAQRLGHELLDRPALRDIAPNWTVERSVERFLNAAFVF